MLRCFTKTSRKFSSPPTPESLDRPEPKRLRKELSPGRPEHLAPSSPPRVKPVIVDPSFCPPEMIADLIIDCLSKLSTKHIEDTIKEAKRTKVFDHLLSEHSKSSDLSEVKVQAPKLDPEPTRPVLDQPSPIDDFKEEAKETIAPETTEEPTVKSNSSFELKAGIQPEPSLENETKSFQLQVPELTGDDQNLCKWEACQRILESQATYTHIDGTSVVWFQVAARLAALEDDTDTAFGSDTARGRILEFVLQDFPSRVDLANAWLYEEYLQAIAEAKEPTSIYSRALSLLIEGYTPRLPTKDINLTKLLLGLPMIPAVCFPLIDNICKRPNRQSVGVFILRELADHRPPLRATCLRQVLDFCLSEDKKLRTSAIVSARKWYGECPQLAPQIETFARNALQGLTELPLDKPVQELAQAAVAQLELYFALTSRTPTLLRGIFTIYTQVDGAIRLVMEREIAPLVRLIGPASTPLLQYLCQFPPGADDLAYRALLILVPSNRKEEHLLEHLLEVVKQEVKAESLSIRFLIPLLPFLNEQEIASVLPTVLGILAKEDNQLAKDFFVKLATPWGPPPTPPPPPPAQMYGLAPPVAQPPQPAPPLMKPSKVIVLLHCKDYDLHRPQVIKAICLCLAEVALFPANEIAEALQQMIDLSKIPVLLMRTMIEFIKVHAAGPSINKIIPPLLSRLVTKSVWTHPTLWEGFIRVCNLIGTASHSTLLKLPAADLEYALSKFAGLKESLTKRVRAHLVLNPSASKQLAHLLHLFTEPEASAKPKNANDDNDTPEVRNGDSNAEALPKKPSRSRTASPIPAS
ncbi:hypothetical protein DSO57_1022668 [Entomophthora muscae]|uniref:Uncharacterized protein n=1 Tax=Entomophthora muscae TaxID=34485 RepID=A0ACC2SRW7_9FUNG|nr:hypothetical protein DSO57_1022668 [Entomophthora muscae]